MISLLTVLFSGDFVKEYMSKKDRNRIYWLIRDQLHMRTKDGRFNEGRKSFEILFNSVEEIDQQKQIMRTGNRISDLIYWKVYKQSTI